MGMSVHVILFIEVFANTDDDIAMTSLRNTKMFEWVKFTGDMVTALTCIP